MWNVGTTQTVCWNVECHSDVPFHHVSSLKKNTNCESYSCDNPKGHGTICSQKKPNHRWENSRCGEENPWYGGDFFQWRIHMSGYLTHQYSNRCIIVTGHGSHMYGWE